MTELRLYSLREMSESRRRRLEAVARLKTDGAIGLKIRSSQGLAVLEAASRIHALSSRHRAELLSRKGFGCHGLIEARASDAGVATTRYYASFDVGSWRSDWCDSDPLRAVLNSPTPKSRDPSVQLAVNSAYLYLERMTGRVVEVLDDALHLDGWLQQHRIDACDQMRLIAYESISHGLGAHTDYEVFTLTVSTGDGLEVLDHDGRWYAVPGGPTVAVLMIGDSLEIVTGGSVESTLHRVLPGTSRQSVVYFSGLDYDTVVQPIVGGPTDETWRFGDRLAGFMVRNHERLRAQFESSHELRQLIAPCSNPMKAAKVERWMRAEEGGDGE